MGVLLVRWCKPLYRASILTNGIGPVTWRCATGAYASRRPNSPATSSTGGKNTTGRKRQLWVDIRGNLCVIWVHAADIADRDALVLILTQFADRFPRVVVILADAGYRAEWLPELEQEYGIEIRIVEKPANQKGFVVQPLRWIVERSIAWWGRYRRLVRDYEALPQSSAAWIHLASIGRLLQRLFPDPAVERPYQRQRRTPAPAHFVSPLQGACL